MLLNIRLGAHEEHWRFRDEIMLSNWITSRPWRGGGGVKILRISDYSLLRVVAPAIRATIAGADEGNTGLQIRIRSSFDESLPASLSEDLTDSILSEPRNCSRQDLFKLVKSELDLHPYFFLSLQKGNDRIAYEAQNLAEELEKKGTVHPLNILLVDTPNEALTGAEYFDYSVGQPSENVLSRSDYESEMWSHYVHHKAAWEVGGDAWEATKLFQGGIPARGDECGLEHQFNAYAIQRVESLGDKDRADLFWYASRNVGPEYRKRRQELESRFTSLGAMWVPIGHRRPQLTAWTARGLAQMKCPVDIQMTLRYSLISVPLATEALSKCFSLEANERSLYWPVRRHSTPASETMRKFEEYLDGDPHSASRYQVPETPLAAEPWCFASFGEYFRGICDSESEVRNSIRAIRNALSHGHNVSWEMFLLLRKAELKLLDPFRPVSVVLLGNALRGS